MGLESLWQAVPGGEVGKERACQCRRPGFDPWVGKIPLGKKWQPTPVLLPGKFHEQRNPVGYSPWDSKESDMTKHTHTHTHTDMELVGRWKLVPLHPLVTSTFIEKCLEISGSSLVSAAGAQE